MSNQIYQEELRGIMQYQVVQRGIKGYQKVSRGIKMYQEVSGCLNQNALSVSRTSKYNRWYQWYL